MFPALWKEFEAKEEKKANIHVKAKVRDAEGESSPFKALLPFVFEG